MRKFWSWTIIFRGHLFESVVNMFRKLYFIIGLLMRFCWRMTRFSLRIICFILGINWIDLERRIERKIRIYIA